MTRPPFRKRGLVCLLMHSTTIHSRPFLSHHLMPSFSENSTRKTTKTRWPPSNVVNVLREKKAVHSFNVGIRLKKTTRALPSFLVDRRWNVNLWFWTRENKNKKKKIQIDHRPSAVVLGRWHYALQPAAAVRNSFLFAVNAWMRWRIDEVYRRYYLTFPIFFCTTRRVVY